MSLSMSFQRPFCSSSGDSLDLRDLVVDGLLREHGVVAAEALSLQVRSTGTAAGTTSHRSASQSTIRRTGR